MYNDDGKFWVVAIVLLVVGLGMGIVLLNINIFRYVHTIKKDITDESIEMEFIRTKNGGDRCGSCYFGWDISFHDLWYATDIREVIDYQHHKNYCTLHGIEFIFEVDGFDDVDEWYIWYSPKVSSDRVWLKADELSNDIWTTISSLDILAKYAMVYSDRLYGEFQVLGISRIGQNGAITKIYYTNVYWIKISFGNTKFP
jgi:hypothetical protein